MESEDEKPKNWADAFAEVGVTLIACATVVAIVWIIFGGR